MEIAPFPALWLVLRTWTQAVLTLPGEKAHIQAWKDACKKLSLEKSKFNARYSALDNYLDLIEETLDSYAARYGV